VHGISPSFARSATIVSLRSFSASSASQAGDGIAIVEPEREFGRAEERGKYQYLAGLSPAGRAPPMPRR
jgi:hypothetical protein